MVDRLDKVDRLEAWRVQEAPESKKGEAQEQESGKDAFAALNERTDWKLLFEKSRLWKRNIQVTSDEIDKVFYVKINLKTDPSLLRIDILLKGGATISPAFMSVSRMIGLKIKNLKMGDPIPEEYILSNKMLRITVPADPSLFAGEKRPAKEPVSPDDPTVVEQGARKKIPAEIWLVIGAPVLFVVLILLGFYLFF